MIISCSSISGVMRGGGLNWRLELKIFIEEEAQWHTVIPEQGKKSYADVVKTPHVLTGAN
jgi:hypothetical protein